MISTMTKLMLVMVIGSFVFGTALSGDLEPPGPPGPTMVTLQQIYDLVQDHGGSGTNVAKTGQIGCWDASGTPISCAGTGQDGEFQAGISVDPRFTDKLDGTVKDNLTGLIWLKDANCFAVPVQRRWTIALADANTLAEGACGLMDGSVAGDWRLPNVQELQSLISFDNNAPALPTGHPFSGVKSSGYWSSTTLASIPSFARYVNIGSGGVYLGGKGFTNYVWPVRGGH